MVNSVKFAMGQVRIQKYTVMFISDMIGPNGLS